MVRVSTRSFFDQVNAWIAQSLVTNMNFILLCFSTLIIKIVAEVNSVSSKHTDDHKNHIKTEGKDNAARELDPFKYCESLLFNTFKFDLLEVPNFFKENIIHIFSFVDQSFLRKKRMEQSTALKNIAALENVQRQHSAVNDLVTNMLRVLATSKKTIENNKFDPKSRQFPAENEALRENIANLIDNIPFLCEFILYYPQILRKKYIGNTDFKNVVDWGYQFSLDFGIYDEHTLQILNLAGQELEIIERKDDYVNPYDRMNFKEQMQREAIEKANQARDLKKHAQKMEVQKKKKEKGPKLSRVEL